MNDCAKSGRITANRVDLERRTVHWAELRWQDGRISAIRDLGPQRPEGPWLLPGFIDAHVHIESSMLVPSEFGRIALRHGTVASVSDPHEIANVLGMEGVRFMLENARQTPYKAFFGAPSCVPATPFETAHGHFGPDEIAALLAEPEVNHLSEMMNFPGVLNGDPEVRAKLEVARRLGYPVDGHAPGLKGEPARRYAAAGITTDHECFSLDEARQKIAAGMSVLIREGSAARNFAALHPLISEFPRAVMLCSDDKHPDELLEGHINRLFARALAAGHDLFDVLQACCANPVAHYRLPVGLLQPGDPMDAQLLAALDGSTPLRVWLDGVEVAGNGASILPHLEVTPVNRFDAATIMPEDLRLADAGGPARVITVQDGELVTGEALEPPRVEEGVILPDAANDQLLLLVMNRYQPSKPALGLIRGFGLRQGAIASSVAHDSHNIVAVGADHASLCAAVNALVAQQGGIAVATRRGVESLPLPVAGLMSVEDGDRVGMRYAELDRMARQLGSQLKAPFMTLSFMALLVIPELKLSDRGLFDGGSFQFGPLQPGPASP